MSSTWKSIFIVAGILILCALFAAFDQIIRLGWIDRSPLPEIFFTWDLGIKFPWPLDAWHTYQGAKMQLLGAAGLIFGYSILKQIHTFYRKVLIIIAVDIIFYQIRNLFLLLLT